MKEIKNKIANKYFYKDWEVVLMYVMDGVIHLDKFDIMLNEIVEEITTPLKNEIENLKEDLENKRV